MSVPAPKESTNLAGRIGVVAFLVAALLVLSVTVGASGAPSAVSLTRIAAGYAHTCVVTGGGGVKCWGSNRYGQLGNGFSTTCNSTGGHCSYRYSRAPIDVVGLRSGVRAVSAGGGHTCALTSGGGVKCWGNNSGGQLGNGSTTNSSTPVGVAGLRSGVSAIAAGDLHSCALMSGGGVRCWGSNRSGQLGSSPATKLQTCAAGTLSEARCSPTPVDVVGPASGITAIAAGAQYTCAVTSAGGATCWGYSPVTSAGLTSGVTAIATGTTGTSPTIQTTTHTCALMSGGGIKCWGINFRGELGNGSAARYSATPVDVVGLTSAGRAITVGDSFSCALMSAGGVKCWGSNSFGQLGNGATTIKLSTHSSTPVGVVGLGSGVGAIAAGGHHACALMSGGGAKCWGDNRDGKLGDGTKKLFTTKPVDVLFSPRPSAKPPTKSPGAFGRCSKAEATAVVKRLRLGDPSVADPVGKLLCGAFTGPGSQAMVVMLRGPGNTGFVEWAVFRWAGGAWQFLMRQPAGASITAAGSDIRQTLPIYRPGDSRCCPTGGTKTRLWHWNGSRFTASSWKLIPPAAAPVGVYTSGYFRTASGNIQCDFGYGKGPGYVRCGIKSGLKPPPPRRGPACTQSNRVSLGATGRTSTGRSICPGEDGGDSGPFAPDNVSRVLGYGKTWSGGGLSCASAVTGLTCRNQSGHGFFLSRAHWRAF